MRFGFVRWIPAHGDWLIEEIAARTGLSFVPLQLFASPLDRRHAGRCAQIWPKRFEMSVAWRLKRLLPLDGLVLTFDWNPAMRIVEKVARRLGLPTVLVPHESVFFNEDLFYHDRISGENVPAAERVLAWGDTQRRIFAQRGYPEDRIEVVGSPKLDHWLGSAPHFNRAEYLAQLGLDPARKTILFAAQPMDNLPEPEGPRQLQRQAIADLVEIAADLGHQLILRLPPGGRPEHIADWVAATYGENPAFRVMQPRARDPLHAALDAIHHADLTVSFGSTMLLEAAMIDRPSLSLAYGGLPAPWSRAGGVPAAEDRVALEREVKRLVGLGHHSFSEPGFAWAGRAFGRGSLTEGGAAGRIGARLQQLARAVPGRFGVHSLVLFDAIDVFILLQKVGYPRKIRRLIEEPSLAFRRFRRAKE